MFDPVESLLTDTVACLDEFLKVSVLLFVSLASSILVV